MYNIIFKGHPIFFDNVAISKMNDDVSYIEDINYLWEDVYN